ncbi:MAG: response regulator [Helicobacteraceae bacterium]|nr:response regulator [Helicobacteraceae bacterium]
MAIVKRNIRVGRPVLRCKLTGDNRLVVCVDLQSSCAVKVLEAQTQATLGGFKIELPPKSPFDFAIGDRAILAYNRAKGVIDLYKLDSREKARSFDIKPSHDELSAFAASDEGGHFALGDGRGAFTFWTTDNAQPRSAAKGLNPIALVKLSANGEYAAIAFENGEISIVKTANLDDQSLLKLHRSAVTALEFVSDYLISGDQEGRLALWSLKSGKLLRVYPPFGGAIRSVERAFDDRAAIVATESGELALANIERDLRPMALDTLGEALATATFDNKTELAVVVTASWNLLFFDLQADKAIEAFLSPPQDSRGPQREEAIKAIVVDDSVTMRRVIGAALKAEFPSLQVFEAGDGKAALDLLEQNPETKIMFLDWNMPTMSGEAVVERIKEAKVYPNLQIIMATTEGGQEKVMQMLRMGVAGYLVKPFRRDAIAKITSKLLERIGK